MRYAPFLCDLLTGCRVDAMMIRRKLYCDKVREALSWTYDISKQIPVGIRPFLY